MAAFRRVEDHRAGPNALGILVPPGQRTRIILRPRALEWDLLPLRFDQGVRSEFVELARDEAAAVARQVQHALEQGAGSNPAQVVANPAGDGFLVWVPVLDLMWLVCRRLAGRPYEPSVFDSRDEAQKAINQLAPFLWPADGANQEYYFNTQNFFPNHQ